MEDLEKDLKDKILVLNDRLWEQRCKWPNVTAWLDNFSGQIASREEEYLHALYLLTQFLYFGSRQIRELLRALYRDFVLYPILEDVRSRLGNTRDIARIQAAVDEELAVTRIFGVGNPSESGTHLLYFFRQENLLPKDLFWETHKIFHRTSSGSGSINVTLRKASLKRYIFLDDLCGSGKQATDYSHDLVEDLRRLNPEASVCYYALFATTEGINTIRSATRFTTVDALYELDDSYKVFAANSRILANLPGQLNPDILKRMAEHYGKLLWPEHFLGYRDGQLLLGFHHNTPDNTLPIIWFDEPNISWRPVFRRYPKIYGA